jgi:hypothetical protein
MSTVAAAGYFDRLQALRAAKQDAIVTEGAFVKWIKIKWANSHAVCSYWAHFARKPPHLRAEPLFLSMFHMWLSFMMQHSVIPKLISFDAARVPVPCFVRVSIFWSHQFALMALAIGLVVTPFFELNDWPVLALVVSLLAFPFPWAFRRLCDEYFWRVSGVQGKLSIHDSWAKKIAARSRLPFQSVPEPSRSDISGSSPTPRSRSQSRDNTPEREIRSSHAPLPASGMATPRRSRSSSRDAPPTSGRATPRRSSSRSGEVVAQAAASSEQANREFLAFRERELHRRAMAFPQSASILLFFALASTAAMAVWVAARYSVEFEEAHHTMWGATYGMAVLYHLLLLEPLMCLVLELRELLAFSTKVTIFFL